jgi:FkbM family methyltransferase
MLQNLLQNAYRKLIQKISFGYGFGKNPIIKKILKNLEKSLKTEFTTIQGSKMFLDPGDSLDLSINGVYGELDTKIIRDNIKEGDIVIDVGANIGYYTLIFAQLVGASGKVFAFEPEPKNFEILKKNIEVNNYQNIIAEQKIVSDESGMVKLFIAEQGIVGHRIQQKTDSQKFIEVESIILDNYLKNLNLSEKINFIKIDVEGAEVKVLEGSKIMIEKSDQLKIFTEFNREDIKKYDYNPEYLLSFLIKNKFNFFLPDYKTNTIIKTDKNTLLSSEELLKENLNILCKK